MLNDLKFYLDRARANTGAKSNSELIRLINPETPENRGMIRHWEKSWRYPGAGGFPSPMMMLRLADLAQVPHETALLDLERWKAEGKPEAAVWDRLIQQSKTLGTYISAPLKLLPLFVVAMFAKPASAAAFVAVSSGTWAEVAACAAVYYGSAKRRLLNVPKTLHRIAYGFFGVPANA